MRVWPDMDVFWTHVCVDCVLYTMIQYTYSWCMYDANSVLGRGLALRESQQARKKRKNDTGVSARAAQPAVQNTKKKNANRMATRKSTRPHSVMQAGNIFCFHTHTHTPTLQNPPSPLRSLLDIASLLKHPVASQRSPTFP